MASEEYKESEMAKIVKRLMDEEGFEFGEAVREAMEQTKKFESKADGGSIGIEVLFTDKMKNGGRVPAVSGGFLKLLAEGAAKGKKGIMELVESGKGRFDEFVETMNQSKKPSELIDSVDIPQYLIKSDEPMTLAKMNLDRKTIDTIENTYKLGLYDEMPEVIKAKNLLERFTKPVGSSGFGTSDRVIDYKRAEDILNVKLNGDETIDELFEIEFRTRPDKIPDEGLADGGRVGLFMGGPALEGQALNIYNSMNAYGFSDQEIANALQGQGLYTPPSSETTIPPSEGIIGVDLQDRGGGRDSTGFGKFGNLDPNTEKTFTKDVFTIDKNMYPGATMTGSFKPTDVTGYKNINTGIYQTLDGKNINHGGIPVKPAFAAVLEALGFGGTDETDLTGLPYKEGYIAGTFTGKNPIDLFTNQQKFFKTQTETIADINAKLAEEQRQKELQAKIEADIARGKSLSQIGRENFTGEGQAFEARKDTFTGGKTVDSPSTPGGKYSSPRKDGGLMFAKGGLATMFTRRR